MQATVPAQLGLFLLLPFVINAAAALVDLYPYGGTRHSAFLIPFAVAGVSLAIAKAEPLAIGASPWHYRSDGCRLPGVRRASSPLHAP